MDENLGSSCLLCGGHGRADATCTTCLVPMPRTLCTRCGAVNAPTATACRACACSLGSDPVGAPCPRCDRALGGIALDGDALVRVCRACHGVFVSARAWCVLHARPDLVEAVAAHLGARGPGAVTAHALSCPTCRASLRVESFGSSAFVVAACPQQHGIWLDAADLGAVLGRVGAACSFAPAATSDAPTHATSGWGTAWSTVAVVTALLVVRLLWIWVH